MAITRSVLSSLLLPANSESKCQAFLHCHPQLFSSFSSPLLNSCRSIQILKQIHAQATVSSSGFLVQPNCSVAAKFITLYSHFRCLRNAVSVFRALTRPDTLAWNSIIKAHVDFGLGVEALFLYRKMRQSGARHDGFTLPLVNRATTLAAEYEVEPMVHCVACKLGFASDLYFCNTMIEVYAKCGLLLDALKLFDEMPLRDLVSWTSMMTAYICEGKVSYAFELFNRMRVEMEPNSVTLIVMLKGCITGKNWTEGIQLHGHLVKNGLLTDVSLQNSLLRLYSKIGCVKTVENLFSEMSHRDVVSWNTLISFFSLTEDFGKVVSVFNQMQIEVTFSSDTLSSVITVLGKAGNLADGEKLHSLAIKLGLDDNILMTSFLDFYAKCGEPSNSAALFREMSRKSSITWNAMMSGFIQNGYFQEALQIFRQMQAAGIRPGAETLGSLVDACAHMGAFRLGKEIHGYLIKNLFPISAEEEDLSLSTCIINMYIRCGSISSARELFNRMPAKDIVAWTSMIDGYGIHGLGIEALNLFHEMLQEEGTVAPNLVTFLSLLSSCSHSGLVREGCQLFIAAKYVYGVELSLDHYTCLVDLLGRSGRLKEAISMVLKMEVCADSRIWGALLAASRTHGDRKVGEYAARKVLELEPESVGYYTLLSNVRAGGGEWDEVEEVRRVVREKKLKKEPGWSLVEVTCERENNHRFVAGDRSHVRREEIYEVLRHLSSQVINESEYYYYAKQLSML